MPSLVHGLAALTLVACTSAATAATRYDPRLRFQTIRTPHFFIHFHQGEEALAERLAALAEDVRAALPAGLTGAVAGRTHVILVDQRDLSNGWANPFPVDTIEITAVPPVPASTIGNLDDWLRTVFTHEYAHILHLDRSNGWIGGLRNVFGRAPPLFPNLFLPQWQVEGIATHQESAATGRGRIAAGDFRAILDEGARAHRVEPLDRVSGGLIDWPSGGGVYVYGGYFHRFLAERYGEATLIRLADETARIPPYFGFVAFRTVYGRSLGDLWRDFETSSGSRAGPPAPPPGRRLTAHGFLVERPRWDPISGRILYSVRNPHGFPALMAIAPEGGPSRELVSRFLGDQVAVAADALYFDQQEMVRNVTLQSDLYAAPRRGRPLEIGRVRRLTREQRLTDPDVSPDGRTVACIVVQPGGRALATANLNAPPIAPTIIASEPEAVFASPRWAPDGRTIAVERRRLGGPSEIVLVDASTRSTRVLVSSARGRNVTPAWTPEGRTLLFASDRDGGPFNLYAIDLDTADVRRVTSTNAGAQAPDVSPDGRTIVYVGYTVEGYDLFVMPIGREEWTAPGPPLPSASAGVPDPGGNRPSSGPARAPDPGEDRVSGRSNRAPVAQPYSPRGTLAPRYWLPEVEYGDNTLKIGALTSGFDVLGRHAYSTSAHWTNISGRPDWSAGYTYDRLWPTIFAVASSETSRLAGGVLREEAGEAGFSLPFRRVRQGQTVFASFRGQRNRFSCDETAECEGAPSQVRNAARLGWMFSSAREYGYSISAQDGFSVMVATEHVRRALGADGAADSATVEFRLFPRLGGRHSVLAVRGGAGFASGDRDVRRRFTAAGNGPKRAVLDFDSDAIGLLRGFHERDIVGDRAAVLNVDYRVPLVRIERGHGTWPLFLRTIHGSLFADVGNAWFGRSPWRALKSAIGAELSLDAVVGYYSPTTFAAGVAWRHDRSGQLAGGPAVYARIGRAF